MKGKPQLQKFARRARELGAVGAKVIPAETVVTAPWVRMKCQFGCGGFNSSLCCPPHSPKPEETREVIACYRRALLIHCKDDVRPTKIVVKLEREIFLDGFYKAFGLGAGPCRLCRTCNLKECTRPDDARPSMEACGIDVFATARANGFPIEVVRDYSCDENRYGVVLIE
jgi:predicted metal-binding protein